MIQHIALSSNGVNEHAKRQQMNLPAMFECAFKQGFAHCSVLVNNRKKAQPARCHTNLISTPLIGA